MKKFILAFAALSLLSGCDGSKLSGSPSLAERAWTAIDESPFGATFADKGSVDASAHQGIFKVFLPVSGNGVRGYTIIKQVQADCAGRTLQTLKSEVLGPDGDDFGALPELGSQPVRAKTSDAVIFGHLCGGGSQRRG